MKGDYDGIGDLSDLEGAKEEDWSPFLMGLRLASEDNSKDLKWDQDWVPVLFIDGTIIDLGILTGEDQDPEIIGKTGRMIIGLGIDMSSQQEKDMLAQLMFQLAIMTDATGMAFLSTVWMSSVRNLKPNPGETEEDFAARCNEYAVTNPPSKDPNRIEKLWIIAYQHGGPQDGAEMVMADIKREKDKPPVLHNWKIMPGGYGMAGRFPEAMEAGLNMAASIREMKTKGKEGEEWKNQ